ncbi:MAG: hypothetical protein ACJAVF_001008, partial [Paraglaciecola sp.]
EEQRVPPHCGFAISSSYYYQECWHAVPNEYGYVQFFVHPL